jgi:hypothetical protein
VWGCALAYVPSALQRSRTREGDERDNMLRSVCTYVHMAKLEVNKCGSVRWRWLWWW